MFLGGLFTTSPIFFLSGFCFLVGWMMIEWDLIHYPEKRDKKREKEIRVRLLEAENRRLDKINEEGTKLSVFSGK